MEALQAAECCLLAGVAVGFLLGFITAGVFAVQRQSEPCRCEDDPKWE